MQVQESHWMQVQESHWILEATDAIHVGGKITILWTGKEPHSVSKRGDFVALYAAGQPARKYLDYKQVQKEKEGQAEGSIQFAAPAQPGNYFARYLRADYTELAVSAPIVVRSALSVLLEEVKTEGMRGNTETLLEMFETVMLSVKANDETFHKQVLESWRDVQDKKTRPPPPSNLTTTSQTDVAATSAASLAAAATASDSTSREPSGDASARSKVVRGGDSAGTAGSEDAAKMSVVEEIAIRPALPPIGAAGDLLRMRVRGSGYYAQKKGVAGADGDAHQQYLYFYTSTASKLSSWTCR